MTSDGIFSVLVYAAFPAAFLYALIYGLSSPWWLTHIGRALLMKACGLTSVLGFLALFRLFGEDYWGRYVVRNAGMLLVTIGLYYALFALLQVKVQARKRRRSTDAQ